VRAQYLCWFRVVIVVRERLRQELFDQNLAHKVNETCDV
jgi:hypothetical protein